MQKAFKGLLCLLLLVSVAGAQVKKAPAASGLPQLIDRELLFGNPEIAGAQLSPDGKYIAFIKPWKDTRNVWVKGVEEPFGKARLLTAESKRPIAAYLWARDSKAILYVKDNDGDENYNVYAVDPAGKPAEGAPAPAARDLTGLKGVRVFLVHLPRTDHDSIYIGLNDRDKAWHDLYRLKISTGEKTLVRKNTERITGWDFDLKDQLRLATRSAENGETEILRVDPDKFTKIYSCSVVEICSILNFEKDGRRVYMQTNKGDGVDLVGLALLDPESGKVEPVESDPMNRVDFGSAMVSEVTHELIYTSYLDDKVRVYFKDKNWEKDYNWLKSQLKNKEVALVSRTADERLWLVAAYSDTEPGETYLFDRKAHKISLQYRIREGVPREALAEMKPVHYKSSDGLDIPAYLTLPKGIPPRKLPTVIMPHGGPWGRDAWGYNPYHQFLANRGYAVLSPNFRASTGYGKKFLNLGNLQWGRTMQDDITWGVKYLVAEGIADPKRVGIFGGSYGGYATLAGVAFTPDVYAAAVDLFGPSNLITLLDSIPPYWEAGRKMFHTRMGDPGTAEGKALLIDRSPLTYASKIKTPLLIAQGANDPRVNKAESEQIVVALRDRGFPVEYLLIPDEGHGFARPVNNMAAMMATEKFLAHYLGGRYQEGGTPDVVARLKEVTVDPKTVVLPKKVDAASVGLPKTATSLQPATYKYKATISAGGQEIAMDVSTTVEEENGEWTATSTMESPMGKASDACTLEKGTLAVRKRNIHQGPAVIDLEFSGGKAIGTFSMNGQTRPVSVDLGGPLFADGAGSLMAIAALPLAEGYTATYRNFDVQKQKEKLVQLKVTGSESVTVAAGTFDTFRVELSSADGSADKQTVWVAKNPRKPVKVSAVIASMGGATMVQELLP